MPDKVLTCPLVLGKQMKGIFLDVLRYETRANQFAEEGMAAQLPVDSPPNRSTKQGETGAPLKWFRNDEDEDETVLQMVSLHH